jgi:hypothetical protein
MSQHSRHRRKQTLSSTDEQEDTAHDMNIITEKKGDDHSKKKDDEVTTVNDNVEDYDEADDDVRRMKRSGRRPGVRNWKSKDEKGNKDARMLLSRFIVPFSHNPVLYVWYSFGALFGKQGCQALANFNVSVEHYCYHSI